MAEESVLVGSRAAPNRWLQLVLGVLCMTMIANLQYGWTLFVNPMQEKFGWDRSAIQIAFTIFIVAETWLVPLHGYVVDRMGPKVVVLLAGLLCGLAWVLNSQATSLPMLYFAQAIGGVGAGAVYGASIGSALKWFPDRRGFAAGVTAAGFGMGSALTIIPIASIIANQGFQQAFLYFGLLQGIVLCVCAIFLKAPEKIDVTKAADMAVVGERRQYNPWEMARTPVFWLMYAMFVMMAAGGLMATAQLGPIAKDFGVAGVPVSILGLTLPALTFALSIDRVLNGLTRPFFGWVSDKIGREVTMFIAFGLEGLAILALSKFGHTPGMFVLLTGLVFFAWGEIYSLFPATCADTFGGKFAAANAGLLYTAKGTAALLVPFSSMLTAATGSWHLTFWIAAALNIITALLAIALLRPMRRRFAA
ncbi:major facilitator superfamily MFS_1 [Methylocella silvestris BL2]|uniref:Major facilitator superfamily MFS_1 n=1 Tax=Methylocella silvestris (strain DSM 15510 / CIP 108128 / LMG 27833 / NCIMB 13906 / BL2) TaxID=395965 RepID=B8EL95_METSB|nr:oxalate/formate MFS antiporter [Methylocella silvestris]ACK49090.1 major facilitator superfamily MFS_1 [Methylocella silvestris BL2]